MLVPSYSLTSTATSISGQNAWRYPGVRGPWKITRTQPVVASSFLSGKSSGPSPTICNSASTPRAANVRTSGTRSITRFWICASLPTYASRSGPLALTRLGVGLDGTP